MLLAGLSETMLSSPTPHMLSLFLRQSPSTDHWSPNLWRRLVSRALTQYSVLGFPDWEFRPIYWSLSLVISCSTISTPSCLMSPKCTNAPCLYLCLSDAAFCSWNTLFKSSDHMFIHRTSTNFLLLLISATWNDCWLYFGGSSQGSRLPDLTMF